MNVKDLVTQMIWNVFATNTFPGGKEEYLITVKLCACILQSFVLFTIVKKIFKVYRKSTSSIESPNQRNKWTETKFQKVKEVSILIPEFSPNPYTQYTLE
jgi:hypothetical protein